MNIPEVLINKFYEYIKEENLRYFKHLKGLTGKYDPILKLNMKRKYMLAHPVGLREGMQIRNWMRSQTECDGWGQDDFNNNWTKLIELTIQKYIQNENNK